MKTAKIIRHRHKYHHYINDDLKEVTEDTQFKIVFSDPDELDRFKVWVVDKGGVYDYDKDNSCQKGKLPNVKKFEDTDPCWCDLMSYYLLELAQYEFYSTIHPYKGEIYIKR